MVPGRDFLDNFMGRLQRQEIDELMSDYHDDAELVAFNFVIKGKNAIRQFFTVDFAKRSGRIVHIEEDAYFSSDDVVLFTMRINSESSGIVAARDALYLKDGKIFRHIALTLQPDKDKEICRGMRQGSSD